MGEIEEINNVLITEIDHQGKILITENDRNKLQKEQDQIDENVQINIKLQKTPEIDYKKLK